MPDREKVIKGLECCMKWTGEPNTATCHCSDCSYANMDVFGQRCLIDLINDALELLKEQEDLGTELTNAVELIHKKNERIEKLLKEQEEREQRICKSICNFIRGACSTDTDDDKDFVCYEIQKCFTEGR